MKDVYVHFIGLKFNYKGTTYTFDAMLDYYNYDENADPNSFDYASPIIIRPKIEYTPEIEMLVRTCILQAADEGRYIITNREWHKKYKK